MSTIDIPHANRQNIPIFPDHPDDNTIEEIKQHIRQTAAPHTWRGHSHTKPPDDAFPVYIDEFDIPAPDTVRSVAPCPCCSPFHAKYKNKGKIAWFPNESVIRIIGPQCFRAINAEGHDAAIIELRRKQKVRGELATIAMHGPSIGELLLATEAAQPVVDAVDTFMEAINYHIDNILGLNLWRYVRGGNLAITKEVRVPFVKRDGTPAERMEAISEPFAVFAGFPMIDRTGKKLGAKLSATRAGLLSILEKLEDAGAADRLTESDRENISQTLPKAREAIAEIFEATIEKQRFLKGDAIQTLDRWGNHPEAPVSFSMKRRETYVLVTAPGYRQERNNQIPIPQEASAELPVMPELKR